jgi:hypothetical protein
MGREMIADEATLRFIQNTTGCDLLTSELLRIVPVDQGSVGKEKREILPHAEVESLSLELGERQGRVHRTESGKKVFEVIGDVGIAIFEAA